MPDQVTLEAEMVCTVRRAVLRGALAHGLARSAPKHPRATALGVLPVRRRQDLFCRAAWLRRENGVRGRAHRAARGWSSARRSASMRSCSLAWSPQRAARPRAQTDLVFFVSAAFALSCTASLTWGAQGD